MRRVFKARLLTGQRGGEVVRMQWSNVELETGMWTIPGNETKNGHPHRVPLTTPVVALLHEQRASVPDGPPWVFSNMLGSGSVHHRARKVPGQLTRRLGFHFRGHDLRRTVATGMAESGVRVQVIARVLNHIDGSPRATKAYDRHTYDAEKLHALETWAQRLDHILTGAKAAVVPFRTANP
jgi:integrase